jgi:hypothetical protein
MRCYSSAYSFIMRALYIQCGKESMLYKVAKQFARGAETSVADFNNMNEAKQYIYEKLAEDARMKLKVTYRIYEGMDLVEEFTESQLPQSASSSESSSGSSSAGSGQRSGFQPTPFNTSPRPSGMPPNWVKDDVNKEDDTEK